MDNCAGAVENRAGLNLKRRRKEEIMSNRLFQGVIHQMRDSIDRTIGVIDESSVIIACSELGKIGEVTESVTAEDIASQAAFVSARARNTQCSSPATIRKPQNMSACWLFL